MLKTSRTNKSMSGAFSPTRGINVGPHLPEPYCAPNALFARLADHGFHDLGIAFYRNYDGLLFDSVRAARYDWQHLSAIGHGQPCSKSAIRSQLDGVTGQGDAGI